MRSFAIGIVAVALTFAGPASAAQPKRHIVKNTAKKSPRIEEPPVEIPAAPTPAPAPSPTPAIEKKEEPVAIGQAPAPRPISVAPILGFATASANVGLGLRGGYTLSNHAYVGGTFVYHVGRSEEVPAPGGTLESSVRLFYPGAEVGYELAAGPVIVRPYAGIGLLFAAATVKSGSEETSDTSSSFAFFPGCSVLYDIPRSDVFVGADGRVLFATAGADTASVGLFATAGMKF